MKASLVLGATLLAGGAAVVTIDNTVQPESSTSIWLQEGSQPAEVIQEPDGGHVNHGTNRTYNSVVIDTHEATGPPKLDDYPKGPPNNPRVATSDDNYGLIKGD